MTQEAEPGVIVFATEGTNPLASFEYRQRLATAWALQVLAEVERAQRKHAPMNSAHEGYAVLLEEVDELWDAVKMQNSPERYDEIRAEAIQVGAMAIRLLVDVIGAPVAKSES